MKRPIRSEISCGCIDAMVVSRRSHQRRISSTEFGQLINQLRYGSAPRAEELREPVAEKVESQHRDPDRDSRHRSKMRRDQKKGAAFIEHRSPRGRGWPSSKAQERQGRFGNNYPADAEGGLYRDRTGNARQQMAHQQARLRGSQRSRGLNVF